MRKLLFTIGLLLSTFAVAQTHSHEPLLQDGKVWNYKLHYVKDYAEFLTCESKYWIDGDTVIDGRTCYKVFSADQYEDGVESKVRYMYEEDGKVYGLAGQETMLYYDFGLSGGDCFADPFFCPEQNMVERCDTVFVKGHARKRIFFNWGPESAWCWVEGIGGRAAVDQPFGNPFSDGKRYELVSCFLGDECLFENDDFNVAPTGYRPVLEDGKHLEYVTTYFDSGALGGTFAVDGGMAEVCQEEVDGDGYRKIRYQDNVVIFPAFIRVREEDRKLYVNIDDFIQVFQYKKNSKGEKISETAYCIYPQDGQDFTIYDFNLEKGDSFGVHRVIATGAIVTKDGQYRKTVTLDSGQTAAEGLGCLNSLGYFFCWMLDDVYYRGSSYQDPSADAFGYGYLSSASSSQGLLYEIDQDGAYEELTADIRPHEAEGSMKSKDFIHDLQGRRLLSAPAKGLYIRGGKKYLVR